ncbi:hypothetical protein FJT64_005564 [Amphibalanus amphitrite]|uniref:Uncharacterized protein n=1 Tax=Amphibalanus amphitrite TaxID=1232801 RepID=A0A6A4VKX1_AMPAM|nr:hypothetical protein FJT64_005564 [Amphibalanus amphitrite]
MFHLGILLNKLLSALTEARTAAAAAARCPCYLLMAWSVVDLVDLADGEPVTSPVGDAVTFDVTPLTRLLTDSDLELLLGDPAAVAAWC